ncbi:YIP1 family protein [Mediterranea massiliensis]|uniref:YIP1 family protein n=1 Tax=Mediterranea massiliensis TaxID=1841865 RepID=A0ABS2DYV2_9BACT|nr:Yip1 family protein [Mediterranea massiliensis]MBM6734548.1 YIP1 family protein [Mediterranea massiliensis]
MDYKELIHITLRLISSPAQAWEEIRLEEDRRKVFTAFVYPMIGLCGLSVFIGSLLTMGWGGPQSFQYAMTRCCAVAVALFGGYFLAAYLINVMGVRWMRMPDQLPLVQQFAGYALVVVFLLRIVLGILPDFQIIAILLQFYTVYIVWEGSARLLRVADASRLRFTLMTSVVLIVCPMVIEWIFNELTVVLN